MHEGLVLKRAPTDYSHRFVCVTGDDDLIEASTRKIEHSVFFFLRRPNWCDFNIAIK